MELKLKNSKINQYPLTGFFIRGASLGLWLSHIQQLHFSLSDIKIYALPSHDANSIWGCLVSVNRPLKNNDVGKHELSQRVFPNLFIPEKSKISPYLSERDNRLLFPDHLYVFHPEFGLAVCEGELSLPPFIIVPKESSRDIYKPILADYIPTAIKSFQIKPTKDEDPLATLEKKAFPKREKMPKDGLNLIEHAKLKLYKQIFEKSKNKKNEGVIEKTPLGKILDTFLLSTTNNNKKLTDQFQQDFEELDRRNQKQIDKLLELLKKNPNEALKYAIPLDPNNSSRGKDRGQLDLFRRWGNFSLFGNHGGRTMQGGGIDLGNHFDLLNNQYHQTAKDLMDKNEYEKAAFIYLKLLKEYGLAANCLVEGKLYHEAAQIYMTYLKNKSKAASCYESGNMFEEAIALYTELKNYEKSGDLSNKIGDKNKALSYYSKAVNVFTEAKKFKEGGDLLLNKIGDISGAQACYLQGWDNNRDAYQCLSAYFENTFDLEQRRMEMQSVYKNRVNTQNVQTFIKVIRREYKENNKLADYTKEFAYNIITKYVATNPSILDELHIFSPDDKQIGTDISRYRYKM